MVPRKGQYMNKDMLLLGQQFQVPINIPKDINNVMFKKGEKRFGVMSQYLRTLIALLVDPARTKSLTTLYNFNIRGNRNEINR